MDRTWYVGRIAEQIQLVYAPFGRREGALAPEAAAFRARAWFADDAAGRLLLLDILDALGEPGVRGPTVSIDLARERVRAALAAGTIAAYPILEKLSGAAVEKPPEVQTRRDEEKHFIAFEFTYPDGSPVKDVPYKLVWPDGHAEEGKLGGDGSISKEDVPPGGYAVIMKEVESVRWSRSRARCGDEVKIRAAVSGFSNGDAAEVLVYREHREQPGDEVATVEGRVKDDAVEVTFAYDDQKTEEQKREEGIARLIAEVSLDGGKTWGKTPSAIEIELKTITQARWSSAYAEDGDVIELGVNVLGFADGTKAKLDVYRFHDTGGGDEAVKSLDAQVAGGRVTAACTYANGGEGDITREGEYYFEITLEGGAPRKARSGLLWCTDAV